MKTIPGKDRAKHEDLLLSDEDRAIGFCIITDKSDNITLLKRGRRVAWLSASMSKEMVKAMVELVKEYEGEID